MNNDELYNVITSDKLTWEGLIRDIVREEKMDVWNINISLLTKRFTKELNKMKEINLRVSGKFILAASILLRMKSDQLLKEEENEEEASVNLSWLFKNINYELGPRELIPRIPMKKKRPVTLDELINALRKAIEVNERRYKRHKEKEENKPRFKFTRVSLKDKMSSIMVAVKKLFKKKSEITFNELLPSKNRFDMIWTFIPLTHLSSQGVIKLKQEKTFGEIYVRKP